MPAETTISIEEELKRYIATRYIEQNMLYSDLTANSARRDLLIKFNSNVLEIGRLASFNENFKNDFGGKQKQYANYVSRNRNVAKGRDVAIKFWEELSDALQIHGLIIIKSRE